METASVHLYEFGDFRVDSVKRLLRRRDGTPVPLTPRVFDTLLYLVEHHDAVLDKERLMEAVWPDSIVEENNLSQNISTLRRILGETPGSHHFIVTVPGRGYRFVAKVRAVEESARQGPIPGAEEVPDLPPPTLETHVRAPQPEPSSGKRAPRPLFLFALAILFLAAAALFWGIVRHPSATTPGHSPSASNATPEKSIAILPFENLSDDKQNAYFADGVQDEILTNLAKLADMKVISRMSVMPYRDKTLRNLPEIARELGVAHLLEGSVQRSGNRVRMNVQLIATRTGSHEWAETYDRDLADVFAIQSEIAQSIARQLHAKISPDEKAAIAAAPTTDLAANALYTQAKVVGNSPVSRSRWEALHLLEQAVTRDPQFVLAYCLIGETHIHLFYGGYDHTPARLELAKVALEHALRLRPEAGEVHLALARYAYYGFRNYDRARAELELARDTLPNDADVYFLSAMLDRRQGRWSEALRNAERSVELDPRNPERLLLAGGIYQSLRRYSESHRLVERAWSIEPRDLNVRMMRTEEAFTQRADPRPFCAELSAILAEDPGTSERIADDVLRCALAVRDPVAAARALARIPAEGMQGGAFVYPHEWFAGLVARTFNDPDAARTSFTAARAPVEKLVLAQPDYAQAWSLLGRIDAALGRKEEAVREGHRACELLPLSKDAVEGAVFIADLAVIYAWVGEKDLALEKLAISTQTPLGVTYGELKLDPVWDALRGDPRFEEIVASRAPQN